ncbi:MAG: CdaR family protein, partial [Atribacterota bacterium]
MIEIKKWLFNNLDIKLLALIMAIILWFYISSEYNISGERYYDIEIRPINLGKNLSIKEIREKVSVGIKGPKNILENISSQKIVGTIDLGNIKEAGEYQLSINVIVPKNTDIVKI